VWTFDEVFGDQDASRFEGDDCSSLAMPAVSIYFVVDNEMDKTQLVRSVRWPMRSGSDRACLPG